MRFRGCAAVLLPLVVLLALVGTVPADAATKTTHDPARDAPAAIDITRFRAHNGPNQIVMTLRVRGLRSVDRFSLSYYQWYLPGSEWAFEGGSVTVRRVPGEGLKGQVRLGRW